MFRRSRRNDEVVGLALSGGGSRAACQVGALKALTEAGIQPHIIAGTSAGAVTAAWYALYPQRLDRLEAIWLALRTRDVFPGSRVRILMNLARHGYVHRADLWESFLRSQVGSATFEDAALPCSVVAVRLRDGERVVFDSGEIVPAILASTAIPGVFPPYRIGDELYVDGGVLEYLPLPTLLERGVTTAYAVDCSWVNPSSAFIESVADRCARIGARAQVERALSLSETRGRTVHHLEPELPDLGDARDFARTADLVQAGYDHTRRYLARTAQQEPVVS